MLGIGNAVRGMCETISNPSSIMISTNTPIYDRESYNNNGEIINTTYKNENDCDGVYEYITMFLKKEDWNRIKEYRNKEDF